VNPENLHCSLANNNIIFETAPGEINYFSLSGIGDPFSLL